MTVWITPLTVPTFSIMNMFVGILIGAIMTLGVYYTNAWETGYLPINGNDAYDNTGAAFNVTRVLDDNGNLDMAKYQAYSQPWQSAGYIVSFFWVSFGSWPATDSLSVLRPLRSHSDIYRYLP